MRKPTKAEIEAAEGKSIPDVIAPGLKVLFCGYNPGLYSGAVGHHFARPGNRFWPTLYAAGLTERVLAPDEEAEFLNHGFGLTNFVTRATARADALSKAELIEGRHQLEAKVRRYRPQTVAVLGIGAFRTAFGRQTVSLGRQPERFGEAILWVLPNPSGLNAHYPPKMLAELFQQLRMAVEDGFGRD